MDNQITKTYIEVDGVFTGKIKYGISKIFEWHEYKYKGRFYNVSQFSDEVLLIGGYCNISGTYKKSVNY